MTWFSGSSSYCHLLTVPLLTSKTFGFVWGINCYSNIVQACCQISLGIVFPFAYLQHSSVVGEICLLCLKAYVSSVQVAFLKPLQWSQVIHGTKVHCWMLHFTQKQPSTGVCWKSQPYPGQIIAVFCGRASESSPPAHCCCAVLCCLQPYPAGKLTWVLPTEIIWLNVGRHLCWRSLGCFQG